MSSNDEAFNFPFISNLFQNKVSGRADVHRGRNIPMRETALCLDDDPLSLRLVEHLLKKRYEVISCATMDHAIRAVQNFNIDLFLCDYHLGERFTGAQAYERLREDHGYNPIHRVLITSYPSQEIEAETLAIGFDRVFAKPLRKEFQMYCLNLRMPRFRNSIAANQ
jgi:CheY-like chemotaxis protein